MTTPPIKIVDRRSGKILEEKVWGEGAINFLYGNSLATKTFGRFLLTTLFRWPLFSIIIGKYYDTSKSRQLIKPFCERFDIPIQESTLCYHEFKSFNDFFTRCLRSECRPQTLDPETVTIPADGRYSFIHNLQLHSKIPAKGQFLQLEKLLQDRQLASKYYGGTAILCRLCPADCHRFYFPCDGFASATKLIHGPLFSVNPTATARYPWIFWTNRRTVTSIQTKRLGTIAYLEIGATNCGSIIQEFSPNSHVSKGQEKGYFRLGGSALILLFEKDTIQIAPDLVELGKSGHEILCQIGQPLGYLVEEVES